MANINRELGIDLGSSFTAIAEGQEIILHEPTTVAIMIDEWKMIEWGQAAKDMFGRVPEDIEVINPIQHGVIAEYEITENLLRYLVQKICGSMVLFRPRLMLCVPTKITSVESRAVHEAGIGAGGRDVYLLEQPLAAALGIDLPIAPPSGNMVICMGGGTNQAAVIAMNSIISSGSGQDRRRADGRGYHQLRTQELWRDPWPGNRGNGQNAHWRGGQGRRIADL